MATFVKSYTGGVKEAERMYHAPDIISVTSLDVKIPLSSDVLTTLSTGDRFVIEDQETAPGLHGLYYGILRAHPGATEYQLRGGYIQSFIYHQLNRLPQATKEVLAPLIVDPEMSPEQRLTNFMVIMSEIAPYIFDTPEWVRNARKPIGQVMVDRAFAPEHVANMKDEKEEAEAVLQTVLRREELNYNEYDDNTLWLGGGFAELERHLDDLKEDFDTLYLTPIFNASYIDNTGKLVGKMHGYNTVDYGTTDPHLAGYTTYQIESATSQERDAMAREGLLQFAHLIDHGGRFILDIALNHTSDGFFAFQDIRAHGQNSRYKDWYKRWHHDNGSFGGYKNWWSNEGMPELNHYEPGVEQYFLGRDYKDGLPFSQQSDTWQRWVNRLRNPKERDAIIMDTNRLREAQQSVGIIGFWTALGIKGWRADVPGDLGKDDFWGKFRGLTKTIDPEMYLIAECWDHDIVLQNKWLRGEYFDGTMNYGYAQWMLDFFMGPNGRRMEHIWKDRATYRDAHGFANEVMKFLNRYPANIRDVMLAMSSSHDLPRLADLFHQYPQGHLAFLLLGTLPGIMSIWLGDEVGTTVGDAKDARDTQNRKPPAYDLKRNWHGSWVAQRPHNTVHRNFKAVSSLRENHAALRTGDIEFFIQDPEVISYARTTRDAKVDTVAVLINRSASTRHIDIPVHIRDRVQRFSMVDRNGEWHDVRVEGNGVNIPAYAGMVMTSAA